jgi:hypothetical protein
MTMEWRQIHGLDQRCMECFVVSSVYCNLVVENGSGSQVTEAL